MTEKKSDVIVVGAGNAALCAAIAAANAGANVTVLEAAPEAESGGNSWFTDGAMRFAFADQQQLCELLSLSKQEAAAINIPPYPVDNYIADLQKAGGSATELMQTLAEQSYSTMQWLRANGVPLELVYDNQSYEKNGKRQFFGNLNVRSVNRGIGLIDNLKKRCNTIGVRLCYRMRATALQMKNGHCVGIHAENTAGETITFPAAAVIIASGGFEANATLRAQHLGEQWRTARVRGSRHNTGGGISMALAAGATRAGNWQGCHAVGMDFNCPDSGDFSLAGDIWKKHSYPYGILINQRGERFVDEGADLRNYTYAKYGREILKQPAAIAWQLFDAQTEPLLRSEYRHEHVWQVSADTHESLAAKIAAKSALTLDQPRLLVTLAQYNAATPAAATFNPAILDGTGTQGLALPKSNWALAINQPPFYAFAVTCGITFTFGGVRVNPQAQLLDANNTPIGGLFAAGEMVGGIFGNNYPGGSGLMSGSVFGRIAGTSAAQHSL